MTLDELTVHHRHAQRAATSAREARDYALAALRRCEESVKLAEGAVTALENALKAAYEHEKEQRNG